MVDTMITHHFTSQILIIAIMPWKGKQISKALKPWIYVIQITLHYLPWTQPYLYTWLLCSHGMHGMLRPCDSCMSINTTGDMITNHDKKSCVYARACGRALSVCVCVCVCVCATCVCVCACVRACRICAGKIPF